MLNLNNPQGEFINTTEPFRAYVGGYRAGKTFVGCVRMWMLAAKYPNIKLGYFAPTYPQIKDIFYPTIEEVAELFSDHVGLPCTVNIHLSDKNVDLLIGGKVFATVKCRSMEKPASIVGFDINHALIDEIDCMRKEHADKAWKKIVARLSSVRDDYTINTADFTTTPEGFNWMYDFFVLQLTKNPEMKKFYKLVKASTKQNAKNLPSDYIDKLYQTYPANLVSAYIDGEFVNLTSGTVYRSFSRSEHDTNAVIESGEPLYIGQDFNVDHMASTIYVRRNGVFYGVDEIYDGFDTAETIGIIKSRYEGHAIYIYPDASGNNRKSNNASESDIQMLRNAGFTVMVNNTNPAVKDRVIAVNTALEKGQLFINSDKCPETVRCLEQQVYDKNGEPDKKSGDDHQNDATGYPIAYELPIIKPFFGSMNNWNTQ